MALIVIRVFIHLAVEMELNQQLHSMRPQLRMGHTSPERRCIIDSPSVEILSFDSQNLLHPFRRDLFFLEILICFELSKAISSAI